MKNNHNRENASLQGEDKPQYSRHATNTQSVGKSDHV